MCCVCILFPSSLATTYFAVKQNEVPPSTTCNDAVFAKKNQKDWTSADRNTIIKKINDFDPTITLFSSLERKTNDELFSTLKSLCTKKGTFPYEYHRKYGIIAR